MHRTSRAAVGATTLLALATAPAGVASAGAAPAVVAPAAHSAQVTPSQGRVAAAWPANCHAYSGATDKAGHVGVIGTDTGRPRTSWVDDKATLGFAPVALGTLPLRDGSETMLHPATDAKGRLLMVETYWEAPAGKGVGVKVIQDKGWGDVTKIVGGYEQPGGGFTFYADRGKGKVERYSAVAAADRSWSVKLLSSITAPEFSAASFVSPAYPTGGKNSMSDVLVGVHQGRLMEWRVRHSRATEMTSTVLQSKGWSNSAKVVAGRCVRDGKATLQRTMMAYLPNGRAYGYVEANGYDAKGDDIKALGMMVRGITATVWPGFTY